MFKKILTNVAKVSALTLVGLAIAHAGHHDPSVGTNGPNVGNIQQTLMGSTQTVIKLIMLIASIAGIAFVAMGLFSFKAASDSAGQQNNNLQKGVVKLIIGGALISLPFLIKVSQNSTLSSGLSSSGITIPGEGEAYTVSGVSQ